MSTQPATFADLLAGFSPAQLDAVEASVAEAPDLTEDQFHALGGVFAGAGERLVAGRGEQEPAA